jgi:hypothetical protein
MTTYDDYTEKTDTTYTDALEFILNNRADATETGYCYITGANYLLWLKAQLVYSTPIVALTGSFGTTGDAIADVGGSFSQTTLNNNFRAIEDKVNAIHAALLNAGLITTS